jgi:hypothetical protein
MVHSLQYGILYETKQRPDADNGGGRNRATAQRLAKIMPVRLLPVWEQLEQVLADVIADRIEPKNAQAAASVARAMVAVLQHGEVEERLRKLEEGTA